MPGANRPRKSWKEKRKRRPYPFFKFKNELETVDYRCLPKPALSCNFLGPASATRGNCMRLVRQSFGSKTSNDFAHLTTVRDQFFSNTARCCSQNLWDTSHVSRRLKMSHDVSQCLTMFQGVLRRLNVSQDVSWCLKTSQPCLKTSHDVSRRLTMSQDVLWCLMKSQDIFRRLKTFNYVSRHLKTFQDIQRSLFFKNDFDHS